MSGNKQKRQKKKMIGSNFKGASVMMAKRSGVAARLRDRIGDHHVTTFVLPITLNWLYLKELKTEINVF